MAALLTNGTLEEYQRRRIIEARENMPPEVAAEFEQLLEDRLQVQPLLEFIPEVSPHLPPPRHIGIITDLVEKARHERVRALVSFPPRHAKTTTLLHAFAWWLKHEPADVCAYFTYSDGQGRDKSAIARDIAEGSGIKLSHDTNNKSKWKTIHGGGLLAGGIGGGLTGHGVSGLFVIDDPYKNREQADSSVYREKVWHWFTEVAYTRLEGASVIIVHTRWHGDDLIGRLSEEDGWDVVNLEAVCESEDDPLGRSMGQALWPDRFPAEELENIRLQIGEWSFAALYQGSPRPKGYNLFGEPRYFDSDKVDIEGCTVVIGADPAATAKTTADYSAAVVIAVRVEERVVQMEGWPEPRKMRVPVGYVQHAYREQVTVPTFVEDISSMQKRWYNAKIGVEAVAGFKAVPQMLLHLNPNLRVKEMPTLGDKFQRAQNVSAMWNAGCIMLPADANGVCPPWVAAFVKEVCNFTGVNDATDDQVDALAHSWNQVAYAPAPVRRSAVAVPSRWR